MNGYVLPVLMAGILVLALATTLLKSSESGPGSMHAPIALALIGGLIFGAVAQKSRMCFAGSIRDVILMRNFDLLTIIGGFFVVMLLFNIATGRFTAAFDLSLIHISPGNPRHFPLENNFRFVAEVPLSSTF